MLRRLKKVATPAENQVVFALSTAVTTLLIGVAIGYWAWGRSDGAEVTTGGSAGPGKKGPPPTQAMLIRVGEIKRDQISPIRTLLGDLIAVRTASVASEVPGRVAEVFVDEGSTVIGGKTVLARIDGTWEDLQEKKITAQIAQAKATLRFEKAEASRLKQLLAQQAASTSEVDAKSAVVEQTVASIDELTASLGEVRERQQRLEILAPFSGKVITKHTEVGEYIAVGAPIVDIVSTGRIDARTMVPQQNIGLLRDGDLVSVRVDHSDLELNGEVIAINSQGSLGSRTFPVRIALHDQDGFLKPGMGVSVDVPTGKASTELLVPRDAVLTKPDESVVWVVEVDTRAMERSSKQSALHKPLTTRPVPVKILSHSTEHYAIRSVRAADESALRPGTRVVTEGLERLVPGIPVRVDLDSQPLVPVPGSYADGQQKLD
ncbi:efflux RND transporter periplasmic adaptor subunit [Roseiconus lacunae]|uniref:Efflux RND transporter periplasmic adaptor subunit n=1 Tax=Roseiconus lacunae TaxID=2605694 RepID=A0ABT7PRP4_9BACT|nr:efflux RND transporter periplasmic adaptor subunit [Roseiconus lacunae]MCD0457951.1 efflux RND transporter periplasmic adaptor subunit [Roseiconus lacunae]MDM4019180.1 efflux RND transporter periplasmic adaptor subunit [Roseiconus lacunae]